MLTPEQEKGFRDYGCVPRCLIALASLVGKPIAREDFLKKTDHLFYEREKYGLLAVGSVAEVLQILEVGKTFTLNINHEVIQSILKMSKPHPILLITEKGWSSEAGRYIDYGHCYLVDSEKSEIELPQNKLVVFDINDLGHINPHKRGIK
jgi:hypothetical protein